MPPLSSRGALVVLIAPDASAQGGITFDQAVQGAFARNCERMGGSAGNYGAGIGTPSSTLSMCPTAAGTVSGASGGSITAGTSQGVQDEERHLLQRLKAKRDGENGGAPALRPTPSGPCRDSACSPRGVRSA